MPILERDDDDLPYYQSNIELMERDEFKPLHTDDEYNSHGEIISSSYFSRTKVSDALKAHVETTNPPRNGHKHPILAMDLHTILFDGIGPLLTFKFLITGRNLAPRLLFPSQITLTVFLTLS